MGAIKSDAGSTKKSRANSRRIKLFCFSKIADLFNPTKLPDSVEAGPGTISTQITPQPLISYSSYPFWWYSLQAFLADIASIEVGGNWTVTVTYTPGGPTSPPANH